MLTQRYTSRVENLQSVYDVCKSFRTDCDLFTRPKAIANLVDTVAYEHSWSVTLSALTIVIEAAASTNVQTISWVIRLRTACIVTILLHCK